MVLTTARAELLRAAIKGFDRGTPSSTLHFLLLLDTLSCASLLLSLKFSINTPLNLPFFHHFSLKLSQNLSLFLPFLLFSQNFSFSHKNFHFFFFLYPSFQLYLPYFTIIIHSSFKLHISPSHSPFLHSIATNHLYSFIFLLFIRPILHC